MLEYNFCNESYWEQIKRGIIQSVPVILSDGSGETYNNWLKICLSMKAAGYTREEVNEWCGAEEFDISRWNGLEPKSTLETARAQIFNIAKRNGYQLPAVAKQAKSAINWFSFDIMNQSTIDSAVNNAQKVLNMIFDRKSSVYMCNGRIAKGKMIPDSNSIATTNIKNLTPDLLRNFLKYDNGMYIQLNKVDDAAFEHYKKEKIAGSILDKHIIGWKYAYIEADPAAEEDIADFITKSKKMLEKLDIPWLCHLFSGKKSIHTIIQLDATSAEEWKNRLSHIHNYVKKSGYIIDEACKNPNRWERFWCAGRNGSTQYIMAINDNPCSFAEWQDRHSQSTVLLNNTESLLNSKGAISNLAMLHYIEKQGFRTYKDGDNIVVVHIDGKFVKKVEKAAIVNSIVQTIDKTESPDVQEKAVAFLKNQPATFFAMLPLIEITKHTDDQDAVFLYFKNGTVKIEPHKTTLIPYSAIQGYIWKDQYQSMSREYLPTDVKASQFAKFIENITGDKNGNTTTPNEKNKNNACSIIGYLLSRKKDPANAKAVLLTDRQADVEGDFSTGGTGKGLLLNGLQVFRMCGEIDGKDLKNDDRFCFSEYQKGQTIYAIQDIKKDFSFESIYNKITGKFIIEKKCKNKEVIPFDDAPKIVLTSNFIPKNLEQESTKRRLVLLELENYYNSSFTPFDEFGNRFFIDWDSEEWAAFDAFIIHCVQMYMDKGLQPYQSENLKQKKILSSVNASVQEWLEDIWIPKNRHELNGLTGFAIKQIWDCYSDSNRFNKYAPATRKNFTKSIMNYFEGGIQKKHKETGDFVFITLDKCSIYQISSEDYPF